MAKNRLKRMFDLILKDADRLENNESQWGLNKANILRTQIDFFMYGGGGKRDKNGEVIFPPEWDEYVKIIDKEDKN